MLRVRFRAILRASEATSVPVDELILQPMTEAPCSCDKPVRGLEEVSLVTAGVRSRCGTAFTLAEGSMGANTSLETTTTRMFL